MKFSDVVNILAEGGVENARFEAALLAETMCGLDFSSLVSGLFNPEMSSTEILSAARKRAEGYPLQYILGEWEFYGLSFYVKEGCLIPRSDTETIVERAISLIPKNARFADVCSGSGCIAVSVLKSRSDLTALALDLYDTPLALTEENAKRHGVSDRLKVERCDVLCDRERLTSLLSDVDFIISNPPYISADTMRSLQKEVCFEPESALCGGDDGMDFYRALISAAKQLNIPAIFEIGYDQADAIRLLANECGLECEISKDLSGNDRCAFIR